MSRDKAEIHERAMRLLESLTPNGSEFVDDPERCAEHIRDERTRQWELVKNKVKRVKELEDLVNSAQRAADALTPASEAYDQAAKEKP